MRRCRKQKNTKKEFMRKREWCKITKEIFDRF
jgi:hypothetical protein